MHRISASYVFPVSSGPLSEGVITIGDDGSILNLETKGASFDEFHEGIICPGFVNTHCHLELSHLRDQLAEKTGMTGFISELVQKRAEYSSQQIQEAIETAEAEMIRNGIVAVGDISNNDSTFSQKALQRLRHHTFLEIFSMHPDRAKETFENGKKLSGVAGKLHLSNSIVPHAPYTMSEQLLKLINDDSQGKLITIHNQESEGESELFMTNSGVMYDAFKAMGIDVSLMRKTGKNSLQSTLPFLSKAEKILLVHNTYTSPEDVHWIRSSIQDPTSKIYLATCPNANLFIEDKLPDYDLFIREDLNITIGTDSLASNRSLSILDEMKTIARHYPHIPLQTLLSWATKNGADFFGWDDLGTIEKGKKPGLNLLKNMNGVELSEDTEVVKII